MILGLDGFDLVSNPRVNFASQRFLDVTHPALPASLTPTSKRTGLESRLAYENATCICIKHELSKFS